MSGDFRLAQAFAQQIDGCHPALLKRVEVSSYSGWISHGPEYIGNRATCHYVMQDSIVTCPSQRCSRKAGWNRLPAPASAGFQTGAPPLKADSARRSSPTAPRIFSSSSRIIRRTSSAVTSRPSSSIPVEWWIHCQTWVREISQYSGCKVAPFGALASFAGGHGRGMPFSSAPQRMGAAPEDLQGKSAMFCDR